MNNTPKLAYKVITYITSLSGLHAYALILGLLFLCGIGLPVPEDMIIISAGILAGQKKISFVGGLLACFVGVLIGDTLLFAIGQRYGRKAIKLPLINRILTERRLELAREKIKMHAKKICFMARFMPGLRAPLFLTAGIMHVPFRTFIFQDGLAALISVPVWIYVGLWFGENLDAITKFIKHVDRGIFIVLIIILLGFIYYQHQKLSTEEEEHELDKKK